jgi:hypothetical protein
MPIAMSKEGIMLGAVLSRKMAPLGMQSMMEEREAHNLGKKTAV